jgi:hypothetical protein
MTVRKLIEQLEAFGDHLEVRLSLTIRDRTYEGPIDQVALVDGPDADYVDLHHDK